MAGEDPHQLHFVFIPFMAPGHMIPMMDMARLFAARGVLVTVVTSALNAARFKATTARILDSGFPFRLAQIPFPSQEVGLPDGVENIDTVDTPASAWTFFAALDLLQQPIEQYLQQHPPLPSCVISDSLLPFTCETAQKFQVPRIVFHGTCCFSLLCSRNVHRFNSHQNSASESYPIPIPGLAHRIEISRSQLPGGLADNTAFQKMSDEFREGDLKSYAVIVNSFAELEKEYGGLYEEAMGIKAWTVGPVSLCNKEETEQSERGNRAAIPGHECLAWLDSKKPNSVVYVSFGSLSRHTTEQLKQIGLALEASNRAFVWVVRDFLNLGEIEKWLADGFEERVKEKGLIIRGWAPQLLILSHPSVGGFVTHCGWNSTLEGISAGVPMLAWPLFGEQFFNEKLVVEVLRIGVDLGIARGADSWDPSEEKRVVSAEEIGKGLERLMDEGEEGEGRRRRAGELGEKAGRAIEEGGSSYANMSLLIEDIMQLENKKRASNANGKANAMKCV